MQLIFYTRKQCSLCNDAKILLQMLQSDLFFDLIEIDIESSDELTEKYGMMIPVVEAHGEVIQYGLIDPSAIEDYLKRHND